MIDKLLHDTGDTEDFPTLEQIEAAEREFWRRIKESGVAESRRGTVSKAEQAENNFRMLLRYKDLRRSAEYVAAELERVPFIMKAALFGSLSKPLWKEVPRFREYRKNGIKIWHEVKDVDIAVWVTALEDVSVLKRARNKGIALLEKNRGIRVAVHECDIFILSAADNSYLGRVCNWKKCPKMCTECLVPACGQVKFLRQHLDFNFRHEDIADSKVIVFFDKTSAF